MLDWGISHLVNKAQPSLGITITTFKFKPLMGLLGTVSTLNKTKPFAISLTSIGITNNISLCRSQRKSAIHAPFTRLGTK